MLMLLKVFLSFVSMCGLTMVVSAYMRHTNQEPHGRRNSHGNSLDQDESGDGKIIIQTFMGFLSVAKGCVREERLEGISQRDCSFMSTLSRDLAMLPNNFIDPTWS
ncbi:hypothetical protein V8F33_007886, partial [Rhypophila sp. PSN 637]